MPTYGPAPNSQDANGETAVDRIPARQREGKGEGRQPALAGPYAPEISNGPSMALTPITFRCPPPQAAGAHMISQPKASPELNLRSFAHFAQRRTALGALRRSLPPLKRIPELSSAQLSEPHAVQNFVAPNSEQRTALGALRCSS